MPTSKWVAEPSRTPSAPPLPTREPRGHAPSAPLAAMSPSLALHCGSFPRRSFVPAGRVTVCCTAAGSVTPAAGATPVVFSTRPLGVPGLAVVNRAVKLVALPRPVLADATAHMHTSATTVAVQSLCMWTPYGAAGAADHRSSWST